jgi:natural product precursor
VKKRTIKKLTLNKESIRRLDSSKLHEVVGGYSNLCTNTAECTVSCQASCVCGSRRCDTATADR